MLLLLIVIAKNTNAIQIVAEGDYLGNQDVLNDVVKAKVDTIGGAPPPIHNLTSSSSCPCDKLLLSSLGPAATFQPKVMGIYTRSYTDFNHPPSYRQNYGADFRLYWLPNGWLVGDKRGGPTGYIHNPDTRQTCPYMMVSGWMYYSSVHGLWYPDTTLVLRCAE